MPDIEHISINGTTYDIPTGGAGAVSSVNGQTGNVVLDADDVGALPDSTAIPTKVSDLQNDSGYITGYTESDPVFTASPAHGISSSDITNWNGKTSNVGTVTSVRVQASSPVNSSTSTAQSTTLNTTISLSDGYGDTKNPYASKTKNYVLASPNGSNGTPSFRALVKADLPSLTASDVGALPSSTSIPTKTSDLQNDSGYITGYTETDPTVPSWAKASVPPEELYIATYGSTVYADALSAYNNGKILFALVSGGFVAPLTRFYSNISTFYFSMIVGGEEFQYRLTQNGWATGSISYVSTSRTVNGKALSSNITLSASDVGALPDSTTIPQGTVTSVRVQATSPVASSVNTAQSSSLDTTISLSSGYGDTQNPYGSKTANQVLAAPNGSNGTPSFRALAAADIPDLSSVYQKKPTVTTAAISSSTTYAYNSWTALCSVSKPSGATFGMAFAYVGVSPNGAGKIRLSVGAGYDCDYYVHNTEYVPLSLSGYVTADTVALNIIGRSFGGSASAASLTVVWF